MVRRGNGSFFTENGNQNLIIFQKNTEIGKIRNFRTETYGNTEIPAESYGKAEFPCGKQKQKLKNFILKY